MLTVRDGRNDIVRGLECGADDYITKPFDQMELLARARSVLGRGLKREQPPQHLFAEGRLSIDFDSREIRIDGNLDRLTPTEYHLLVHLAQSAGKLMTHTELLTRLWGQEYSEATDYLKVHVMHLRRKLADAADAPRVIMTERSLGYKMTA